MDKKERMKKIEADFDWGIISQNPSTGSSLPSNAGNGGSVMPEKHVRETSASGSVLKNHLYQHQPVPNFSTSFSSLPSANHNGNNGFLLEDGGCLSFPINHLQKQQQQLISMAMANRLDLLRHQYSSLPTEMSQLNPYDCTKPDRQCYSRQQQQSFTQDFFTPIRATSDYRLPAFSNWLQQESPLSDQNLESYLNRLTLSSSHNYQAPSPLLRPTLPSSIDGIPSFDGRGSGSGSGSGSISQISSQYNTNRNMNMYPQERVLQAAALVNRNMACHDHCCNPPDLLRHNQMAFSNGYNRKNNNLNLISQSRQHRTRFPTSLDNLRGMIYIYAQDKEGSRFLQKKCDEGKPEDIDLIFSEIRDHIREVMMHPDANHLVQKLFKFCSEKQLTEIIHSVSDDDVKLLTICLDSNGTRTIQKLIEHLTTSHQKSLIVSALRRITVTLIKNTNGHHVIQQCLKSLSFDEVQQILTVVADNCVDIATDKCGCCVLQQCVLQSRGITRERLLDDIIANALSLSEHPYGNYVVQFILGQDVPEVTKNVVTQLAGNFVPLSMNKYSSNVVEKCLTAAKANETNNIVREIVQSPNFLSILQHPFGNYVAQTALKAAKGPIKDAMRNQIQKDYGSLNSHPHGKRVLALAKNIKGNHHLHGI